VVLETRPGWDAVLETGGAGGRFDGIDLDDEGGRGAGVTEARGAMSSMDGIPDVMPLEIARGRGLGVGVTL
jgi:hypothetical protein